MTNKVIVIYRKEKDRSALETFPKALFLFLSTELAGIGKEKFHEYMRKGVDVQTDSYFFMVSNTKNK